MKRCNNCGWFNLDSVTRCEKCEEESFEYVAETSKEQDVDVKAGAIDDKGVVSKSEGAVEGVIDEHKLENAEKESIPKQPSFANATIAYGSASPVEASVEKQSSKKSKKMAATVMDASIVVMGDEALSCPKCRYPLSGHQEYCPNCGATIRRSEDMKKTRMVDMVEIGAGSDVSVPRNTLAIDEDRPFVSPSSATTSAPVSNSGLKVTVRDIPDELVSDNANSYRLVPVDAAGEAIIELNLNEIVIIAGKRYKFQK